MKTDPKWYRTLWKQQPSALTLQNEHAKYAVIACHGGGEELLMRCATRRAATLQARHARDLYHAANGASGSYNPPMYKVVKIEAEVMVYKQIMLVV
jgi:hypothetical protein